MFESRMARMEMDYTENDPWISRFFHEIHGSKFSAFDGLRFVFCLSGLIVLLINARAEKSLALGTQLWVGFLCIRRGGRRAVVLWVWWM